MYSHLEEYIYELYTSIGVENPSDLNMKFIAKKLGVKIIYKKRAFRLENEILLTNGTKSEEWVEFGHEICHFLRHVGNQLNMHSLFRNLQEWQSDYFAYHFCVPTFMLVDFEFPRYSEQAIQQIAQSFNVTIEFARTRFNMYQNKKQYHLYQEEWQYSQVADYQNAYSTEEVIDMEFNLDHEILPDEFYEFFDLSTNKDAKIAGAIKFIKHIRKKQLR
ncbi:ImmA/IrrE family metallo-endopeptidase [Lederbergia wuyishanensis]|uniref:Zn-dependent peptidase ImmA (M78 family) n=1 Tax=Lederbergia wuyishanensis TaxID=1347903 RepID=A0ABU0D766_9BACI|nr:ImmA/IrrE family metallo-endopeptidase [Lederbergia wuyishanensis]MCJ8008940.1 ImmA/IrrE family metallo-endopeptidase [Lederbergia wuyishanensis]MDQ0344268.1 Zn-dependent peptidase ImmA (M78 family) [Lederbergia wuyishanensis]